METNYKGTDCPFKPIFCQEGYCSECWIGRAHAILERGIINEGLYSSMDTLAIKADKAYRLLQAMLKPRLMVDAKNFNQN